MKSAIAFLVGVSVIHSDMIAALTPMHSRLRAKSSILSAMPPSSGPSWGSKPSKTARESAFNVEWEPMTELDRRIEDGVNYEHMANNPRHQRQNNPGNAHATPVEDDVSSVRGVFVGYRVSHEEYDRLKSADPGL
jgi:hypothetical protein